MKQIQNDHEQTVAPRVYVGALGLAIGFGAVFQWFFYANVPGVAFPIFAVLFLACSWVLANEAKVFVPRIAVLPAGALLFFSCMVMVRSGAFITLLNIFASVYLYSLLLYLVLKPAWPGYVLRDYLAPVTQVPFRVIGNVRGFLYRLKPLQVMAAKHPVVPRILRGTALALPLLLVFALLFSSADLVFRKYVTYALNININADVFFRLAWMVIVGLLSCGVFGLLLRVPREEAAVAPPAARPARDVETKIVLGSLNVLFLAFIVIQLAYLFGGAHNITAAGFTYAQYARKGFFELIAVAVLSLAVILGTARYSGHGLDNRLRWFQLLAGGLTFQVGVIMVSAFRRLALYEGAYGFTTLRMYSHLFIVWLAVVFGLLLYKFFSARRESWFAAGAVVSAVVFLVVLNVVSVDAFVARKNIGRYYATGKLDVGYLSQLSDDATPEVVKVLDALPADTRAHFAGSLYQKRENISDYERHWQSFNFARETALRALNSRGQLLTQSQDLRIDMRADQLGND